jgi:L-ribulose-5-phosphate 3-epimerase
MQSIGPRIGFMQGRLCDQVDGRIQAFPARDWRLEFEVAARLELGLMEWTLDDEGLTDNPLLTETGRAEIGGLCALYGIRIPSVTGDCFMQAPFWKERAESSRHLLVRRMEQVIAAASAIKADCIVVPLVDAGCLASSDEEARLVNVMLHDLLPVLDRSDVRIAFESDYPPDALARLITRFPARRFGINYDIGNSAALGYETVDELFAYGDRIINVHVKDRPRGGTTVPLGTGDADLPTALSGLVTGGYRGNYILQTARALDGDHAGAIARYAAMTRTWIAEGHASAV